MSADPRYRQPRTAQGWPRGELVGLIAVIWLLAVLLFFILIAQP